MSNLSSHLDKNKIKSKRIIIWLVLILSGGVVIFLNLNRIVVSYLYVLGSASFNEGDNIYLSENLWKSESGIFIEPKMIRPITVNEVRDSAFLNKADKNESLVIAENQSLKAYVANLNFGIKKDFLKENGTGKIGKFIEKRILPTKTRDGKTALSVFYVIKPDDGVLYKNFYKDDMPKNYKFADNYLYVFYSDANNKELAQFSK